MCAKLQAQLAAMQGSMTEKLVEQQSRYEQTILDLQNQVGKTSCVSFVLCLTITICLV